MRNIELSYGDTTFESTDSGFDRSLLITSPTGEKEQVLFKYSGDAPADYNDTLPSGSGLMVTSSYLYARNTYYWDKRAYASGANNYAAAKLYHWLHTAEGSKVSNVLESLKPANERRIHYNYPGQVSPVVVGTLGKPSIIARVMDDGSTQLARYEYNAFGKITKMVTPGDAATPSRTTTYKYASNNIDLLAIYQRNSTGQSIDGFGVTADLLWSFAYDTGGKHLVTSVTDASGQTTAYTYNSYGQVLTITNPKGETTTCTYDRDQDNDGMTDGYLVQIAGPVSGAVTQIQYDDLGRIAQITDSQGYAVTTAYEAISGDPLKTFNRPSVITYPDGSTAQFFYNRLDLEWSKDRLGRWSRREHDANRRVLYVQDPAGRITNYEWCSCGSPASIVDAEGHQTNWLHDVQGRLTDKIYSDGAVLHYTYESIRRPRCLQAGLGKTQNQTHPLGCQTRLSPQPRLRLRLLRRPLPQTPVAGEPISSNRPRRLRRSRLDDKP